MRATAKTIWLPGMATALVAAVAVAALLCGPALAERHQQGNLIVAMDGRIAPHALPRHRMAPAGITVSSGLSTSDGSTPPRVRRIELGFAGGNMRFDRRGLASCPRRRLRNSTAAEALARCGPSLVGHGRLDADVLLPHQAPLPVHARVLDFNGRTRHGGLAILVHAYSSRPPASFVLTFVAHRHSSGFPLDLAAAVPRSIGSWSRLTGFQMTLGRRFRQRGSRRSYIDAACPAPRHFTGGFAEFHIDYLLAGDRRIGDTIVRGCRVRR